jgi:glucosylglycerol-phosphate synthase
LTDVDVTERVRVSDDLISEGTALTERTVPTRLRWNDRDIMVSTAPVGVDPGFIAERSEAPETVERAAAIREELGDAQLIISVGRTDYTKGGVEQMLSFERILDAHPELYGKVRLMHVSVSANRNMTVYAEVQAAIEETAGRINGRFGRLDWQPISLISRPIPFAELVAYYKAADIAWITPLADGMNLVCKEYVSARTDDTGVLVLSEFAGAAVELGSSVIANPFSNRSMDEAILRALDMPEDEQRARMGELRKAVRKYDVRAWSRSLDDVFGKIEDHTSPEDRAA